MAETEKQKVSDTETKGKDKSAKKGESKVKEAKAKKPGFGKKAAKFFRDYKSELKKVVWPSKTQLLNNTGVVLAAIVIMCLFIFALDTVFSFFVKFLAGVQ